MGNGNSCTPPPTPGAQVDRIKSFLAELDGLDASDYEVLPITLKKAMLSGTVSGSDTYATTGSRFTAICEIHPHLAMIAITNESAAIAGVGNPGIRERIAMKAMNCRVSLQNKEDRNDIFLGANKTLSLASLHRLAGGAPMDLWRAPYLVPGGRTIQMDVSLVDTTASVIGGETEYGLMLVTIQARQGR